MHGDTWAILEYTATTTAINYLHKFCGVCRREYQEHTEFACPECWQKVYWNSDMGALAWPD